MTYLVGLLVVGLFFFALHYFTELSHKQKALVSTLLFFIIFIAIAYNSHIDAKSAKMLDVITRFNQHKNIKCGNIDVNSTNFSLSIGTYTFIGKKESSFQGEMLSVSNCE